MRFGTTGTLKKNMVVSDVAFDTLCVDLLSKIRKAKELQEKLVVEETSNVRKIL